MTDDAVLLADERRRAAMVAGDAEALDRLLADELIHTHATARSDTKADYLAAIRKSPTRYARADAFDRRVMRLGTTAWMHGRQLLEIRRDGTIRPMHNRFLAVWILVDGDWKLAAFCSTKLPEPA